MGWQQREFGNCASNDTQSGIGWAGHIRLQNWHGGLHEGLEFTSESTVMNARFLSFIVIIRTRITTSSAVRVLQPSTSDVL